MSHTIGPCRAEQIPELVDLANRIFRGRRDRDMGADGKLVAHVGICIRDAVTLGAPLRVASIGAVCTDPDYRGRGLGSELMADAAAHSRAQGASLMLNSGGRGLYHRLGYVTVGRFTSHQAPAGGPGDVVELSLATGADRDAVVALHQREPVRFLRPLDDWNALLEAGMLMNQ